jgi:hypothetical protein
MKRLLPQVEAWNGDIEVLIFFNNMERNIGYYRQKVLDDAKGDYISFVDDDDLVAKDFCNTIMPLLDGTDYIGFKVRLLNDGKKLPPVYHSLRYTKWDQDDKGYYRGITHLNPLRTEIARQSEFSDVDHGEDYDWAMGVQRYMSSADRKFTEHFIDKDMYIYDHWGHDPMLVHPDFKSNNVRYHAESSKSNQFSG